MPRSPIDFLSEALKRAARRLSEIRSFGFHEDGLRPDSAVRMYKMFVRPILEFGAQFLDPTASQLDKLECFQAKALRSLLGLASSVKRATVRLLCGVAPMRARFELLKLNFYFRIRNIADDTRLLPRVLRHSMITLLKPDDSTQRSKKCAKTGFGSAVQTILIKFNMPNLFTLFEIPVISELKSKRRIFRLYEKLDFKAIGNAKSCVYLRHFLTTHLDKNKPYQGTTICKAAFLGESREFRTTFLRTLSGFNFCTEKFSGKFRRNKSGGVPVV